MGHCTRHSSEQIMLQSYEVLKLNFYACIYITIKLESNSEMVETASQKINYLNKEFYMYLNCHLLQSKYTM